MVQSLASRDGPNCKARGAQIEGHLTKDPGQVKIVGRYIFHFFQPLRAIWEEINGAKYKKGKRSERKKPKDEVGYTVCRREDGPDQFFSYWLGISIGALKFRTQHSSHSDQWQRGAYTKLESRSPFSFYISSK